MKRAYWGITTLLWLLAGCAQSVLVMPEPELDKYKNIAILPFESDNYFATGGTSVADAVMLELLEKAKQTTVIERARIDAVLHEQNLSQQGYISPETAVQVGRLLGVQALVTGSVSVSIGDIRPTPLSQQRMATGTATVRVIDTTTGQVVWAKREQNEYAAFINVTPDGTYTNKTDQEMVQALIQNLGQQVAKHFYPHYELR